MDFIYGIKEYIIINIVGNDTNDPAGVPKYVGNTAGFIYSLRDTGC
jgi:hypothetical protein